MVKISILFFIVIVVFGIFFTSKITGGDEMFLKVSDAIRADAHVRELVSLSPVDIRKNGGPSEVELSTDGLRSGFYSVDAVSGERKESLKVYWRETKGHGIEIQEIYRSAPFRSDELLWKNGKSP